MPGKVKMGKKLNPTTAPGDDNRNIVTADRDRYGRPLNPPATKANTRKVYDPKTRQTSLVNKKTGKTFAVSYPGPKFRPGVKKVGR
jgi:hypothetical protein